jgi:hypothetical protein
MKRIKILIMLSTFVLCSCGNSTYIRTVDDAGTVKYRNSYVGKVKVERISLKGGSYPYFSVISRDVKHNEVTFNTYSLCFAIGDSVMLEFDNNKSVSIVTNKSLISVDIDGLQLDRIINKTEK